MIDELMIEDEIASRVEFFTKAVKDPVASKEKGYPVLANQDWIRIFIDPYSIQERKVLLEDDPDGDRVADPKRFPRRWAAYKEKREDRSLGVPLEELWPYDPAKVEVYKAHKVHTVEQLAVTSDGNLQAMGMGSMADRQMAKKFIKDRKEGAASQQIKELVATVERLKEENKELGNSVAEFLAKQPKENRHDNHVK